MTSGRPNGASDVALSYMYSQKDAGLYGYSMAIGVVISVLVCTVRLCQQGHRPRSAGILRREEDAEYHRKIFPLGGRSLQVLYLFLLVLLAVIIIVPVAWVFMASIKQNAEFYGNPWALPAGFYWQNPVNAWNGAKMGKYMLNSVIVTALALVLLLVIALPAAYCLSRFRFKGRRLLNTLFMAGLFINVNYIVVPIFLMLRDGDVWLKEPLWQQLPAEQSGGAGGGVCSHGSAFYHLSAFGLFCHPAPMILRRLLTSTVQATSPP